MRRVRAGLRTHARARYSDRADDHRQGHPVLSAHSRRGRSRHWIDRRTPRLLSTRADEASGGSGSPSRSVSPRHRSLGMSPDGRLDREKIEFLPIAEGTEKSGRVAMLAKAEATARVSHRELSILALPLLNLPDSHESRVTARLSDPRIRVPPLDQPAERDRRRTPTRFGLARWEAFHFRRTPAARARKLDAARPPSSRLTLSRNRR